MISYRNFVRDLKLLVVEGVALRDAPGLDEDPRFRAWRHAVIQLLRQITAQGYLLRCFVNNRRFGDSALSTSDAGRKGEYQLDIDDTLMELHFIIDNYEKHGKPPKAKNVQAPSQLELAEQGTFAWLWRHVPWRVWGMLFGLLVTVFAFGAEVGRMPFYQHFIAALHSGQILGQQERAK